VITTDRELIGRAKQGALEAGAPMGALRVMGTTKLVSLLMYARKDPKPNRHDGESENDENDSKRTGTARQSSVAHPTASELSTSEPPSASEPPPAFEPLSPMLAEFQRANADVKRFAASQRNRRRHERKRRRRPDGFSAPFAEKTWHRVLLADKWRRLLEDEVGGLSKTGGVSELGGSALSASEDEFDFFMQKYNEQGASSTHAATQETHEVQTAADTLLADVRLDHRQRQALLRFGDSLQRVELETMEGQRALQPEQVVDASGAAATVRNLVLGRETLVGEGQTVVLPPLPEVEERPVRLTRRERQRTQRERERAAAAELRVGGVLTAEGEVGGGSEPTPPRRSKGGSRKRPGGRRIKGGSKKRPGGYSGRGLYEVIERERQLRAISLWLERTSEQSSHDEWV